MGEMKIQLKLCIRLHLTLKLAIQYYHAEHNSVRMFFRKKFNDQVEVESTKKVNGNNNKNKLKQQID